MGFVDEIKDTNHYSAAALRAKLEHAGAAGSSASYAGPVVSAAGAIDPTQRVTYLSVDATKAYTLADGTYVGQTVKVVMLANGTNTPVGTVTPAHTAPASGATYTTVTAFGAIGDYCEFIWDGTGWLRGAHQGVTFT